jgi:hypothetical protein
MGKGNLFSVEDWCFFVLDLISFDVATPYDGMIIIFIATKLPTLRDSSRHFIELNHHHTVEAFA